MANDPKILKYIDPMTDYGFKKIFKNKRNKRLMLELLQNVLNPAITEIEYSDTEHIGETEDDRRAYVDVECRAADGTSFIVEVQLRDQKYFHERAVYYSTFLISEQAPKGRWNYDFRPVYFLGLMNFSMRRLDPEASKQKFIHRYSLREDETHTKLTDRLNYVFMEVARFNKEWEDCETFEEKFLYYMKNLPNFAERPEALEEGGFFEELLRVAEYESLTKKEKHDYQLDIKMRGDYQNTIDFAREQGHEAGFAEGMEKKAQDTAISLKAAGVDIFVIAKATGLSPETVRNL